jgi:hypothetical protein
MKRILGFLLVVAACSKQQEPVAPVADAGADATTRQGDANDWSCLGKVSFPALSSSTASVTFKITDPLGRPSADIPVRACPARDDAMCSAGTAKVTTDSNGEAMFDVPADFDGYWEAIEPTTTDLHFVPFRQFRSPDFQWRVEWHFDELRLLTDPLGVKFDTTRGHVLIEAHDCRVAGLPGVDKPPGTTPESIAGGVTFVLDPMPPGVVTGYSEVEPHALIRTDLDETQDGAGGGGFLNVPPGVYTVTGIRKSTGQRISTQRIHVRADSFSDVLVVPTP